MAHIPKIVGEAQPPIPFLPVENQGKVRDSHTLAGHADKILVHATDRVSAFDIVLPILVRLKGAILTAMNHFWVTQKLSPHFETDLISAGAGIDQFLPEEHRGNPELQKACSVVRRLSSPDIEDIVRFHLTGSGFKDYMKDGTVCGHRLPPGLIDGSRLPTALYTPSTKAKVGHDENISVYQVIKRYGSEREHMALMMAGMMYQHALSKGIILADTKMEIIGNVLIDEKGTPDCCRFWDLEEWKKAHAKGKLPTALDKQFVRSICISLGISKLDPKDPGDLALLDTLPFPDEASAMTTLLYRYIFWRLTGDKLEKYQREKMGIQVEDVKPKIEILIGSKSDLPQIEDGWVKETEGKARCRITIMSCHRNADDVRQLMETTDADIIIAGAGKAADLPGIAKSWLTFYKRPLPVIGVGFKGETVRDDLDAISSIEGLPGQPVELDPSGHAYFGPEGFRQACHAAVNHEFLPRLIEAKPVEIGIRQSDW